MNTSTTSRMVRAAAVLALASVGIATAGAANAASTEAPSLRVNYSDLNLSNPSDAHLLYRRLKGAAADVCGNVDSRDLQAYSHFQLCYRSALERAVQQVNAPELLAVYRTEASRNGFSG